MVDNIVISGPIRLPTSVEKRSNSPFEYNGLLFSPYYDRYGEIKSYVGITRNLRVSISPYSERITIANSFHKFFHGNNYSDFTFSEFEQTIHSLSNLLKLDLLEFKIHRIEYGCNSFLERLESFMDGLKRFRGKCYQPMLHKGSRYGAECTRAYYSIKAYDKSFQVKKTSGISIRPNLLRWELRVTDRGICTNDPSQLELIRSLTF